MSTADTSAEDSKQPPDPKPEKRSRRKGTGARPMDTIFKGMSLGSGSLIFITLLAVAVFLALQSRQAVMSSREVTGDPEAYSLIGAALPLVYGTVLASVLALLIAVPVSIGVALFISHFAPRRLATPIGFMIDLLAAVPSVVFGLWGGLWLVPRLEPLWNFLNNTIGASNPDEDSFWNLLRWPENFFLADLAAWPENFFIERIAGQPVFNWAGQPIVGLFGGDPVAPMRNVGAAAIVLAVMVLPIITALAREIFLQTPRLQEEAALALGATRWETIRTVVLPFGRSGVTGASMLGLGRALGETMAVLMILAPGATFSTGILEVGMHNTIAANIAADSSEATPLRMSQLIFTGLVLFFITFVVNAVARAIVARAEKR